MYKRIIYGFVILYTVAPILSVCVVAVIAGVCGCEVDEGGPHPCIIFGMDIGPLLCQMGRATASLFPEFSEVFYSY